MRRSYAEAAERVRQQLSPLGVALTVEALPDDTFLEKVKRNEIGRSR